RKQLGLPPHFAGAERLGLCLGQWWQRTLCPFSDWATDPVSANASHRHLFGDLAATCKGRARCCERGSPWTRNAHVRLGILRFSCERWVRSVPCGGLRGRALAPCRVDRLPRSSIARRCCGEMASDLVRRRAAGGGNVAVHLVERRVPRG